MSETNYNTRPYNSVRFICRCGEKHTFPRAPSDKKGQRMTSDETYQSGTRHVVTKDAKEVHCSCGLITCKDRKGFNGKG